MLKNGCLKLIFFQISEKGGGLNSTILQNQGAEFYSRLKKGGCSAEPTY